MPADVASDVFSQIPRIARAVRRAARSDGVEIIHANGRCAGQTIMHAHIHVIPRFPDDGFTFEGGPLIDNDRGYEDAARIAELLEQEDYEQMGKMPDVSQYFVGVGSLWTHFVRMVTCAG